MLTSINPDRLSAAIISDYRINRVPGKKIDHVLCLEQDRPVHGVAATAAFANLCETLPEGAINHAGLLPFLYRPVAVSFKSKRDGTQERKGQLQMDIRH
ncbi:hypothetical protein ColLi_12719 [Colletotrichum liriopes]|uniref:PD-(D/E)XK nuclease-like domain-containing protein n=1 Tax=Colletotrichum liriopes TaxID=708192 RepID=A0AA37GYW0_9PEZI|nr:hypothetical protein ColLi_12719 [Colletotrichum liriopes]